MSTILTGQISRRVAKYATEEERQQAKLISYKKYASKKYYCEICDKTMSIYNYTDHIQTNLHNNNNNNNNNIFPLETNSPNK